MVTLSVGHNRPYDQHHSNRLIIEQKSKYYAVIFRHWKFMFKRIFRVSECVDARIYTKRAREKSTKLTKLASCVLGHPKCFRRPKTTYRYPTLQSRAELMIYDKNMPNALLMIIQKKSLPRIVTNVTTLATELKYTKCNLNHIFA